MLTTEADDGFLNVGLTASGGLVAGWSQPSTDGTQELLEVQQFNSSGVATASPITVASIDNDTYSFNNATMSVAADGSFAIAWSTSANVDGSQYLQALQYNDAGVAQETSPLDVASWSSDTTVTTPAISVDGNGGFIATWMQSDDYWTTGNADLMAVHYDASGNTAGPISIDDTASPTVVGDSSYYPSEAVSSAGGNWGITWVNAVSGNLMGQFYNAQDVPLGDAFEIASSGSAGFGNPLALASNANGDLMAAWATTTPGEASMTANYVYNAQQLQVNPPPVAAAIPDQDVSTGDPQTIDLSSYFTASNGDAPTYTAVSGDTSIATTSVSGSDLTFNFSASTVGSTAITVTATDSMGNTASATFNLYVNPAAPTLPSTAFTVQSAAGAATASGGDQIISVSQLTAGETAPHGRTGVAITAINLPNGTLNYSTNGGSTWTPVGAVSTTNALLLMSTDELQYVPNSSGSASESWSDRECRHVPGLGRDQCCRRAILDDSGR